MDGLVMMYEVQWDYFSSYGGPWTAGYVVKITPEEAKRINIDSPGVLVNTGVKTKETNWGKTRQLITGQKRSGWDEMPVDQLRAALKERGLKQRGLKTELVKRLKEYEKGNDHD